MNASIPATITALWDTRNQQGQMLYKKQKKQMNVFSKSIAYVDVEEQAKRYN